MQGTKETAKEAAMKTPQIKAAEHAAGPQVVLPPEEFRQRIADAKDAIWGSDGPDTGLARDLLGEIPGSEKAVQRLNEYDDFLKKYEKSKPADVESENWFRANALEHSFDELATQHGVGRIPNVETEEPGFNHASTPILDQWLPHQISGSGAIKHIQLDDPEVQQLHNFRDAVQRHLQATGQTEHGLLSDWFMGEKQSTLNKIMEASGDPEGIGDLLTQHLEKYP